MGVTARLLASLGLDGKDFNAGISGAERRLAGFEGNLKSIRRSMHFVMIIAGLEGLKTALTDLEKFQKEKGIQILDDDQMQRIKIVTNQIEEIKMRLIGAAAGFADQMITGLKSWAAALGSSGDYKAWADSMTEQVDNAKEIADAAKILEEAQKRLADDAFAELSTEEKLHEYYNAKVDAEQKLEMLRKAGLESGAQSILLQATILDIEMKGHKEWKKHIEEEKKEYATYDKEIQKTYDLMVKREEDAAKKKREEENSAAKSSLELEQIRAHSAAKKSHDELKALEQYADKRESLEKGLEKDVQNIRVGGLTDVSRSGFMIGATATRNAESRTSERVQQMTILKDQFDAQLKILETLKAATEG
jgi:hypothetical protein